MTWRLDLAQILDDMAKARFVAAHEDFRNGQQHDPMYSDARDRTFPGFPQGFPVPSSTTMWRGANTLRWNHEFDEDRGSWRRGWLSKWNF